MVDRNSTANQVYRKFLGRLLLNYAISSIVTVLGVGGIFIFSILTIPKGQAILLSDTLMISLCVMWLSEFLVLRSHLRPIAPAFHTDETQLTFEQIQMAYLQVHRFPWLSVKRTMGPHLLGLSIPAIVITLYEMSTHRLTVPYAYIIFAAIVAVLIASMHSLIEFFLQSEAIRDLLRHLNEMARNRSLTDLSLHGTVLIPIRVKFTLSLLIMGIFPLLLFSFATQIRLAESAPALASQYWPWALILFLFGAGFAVLSAWLLARNIVFPIAEVKATMHEVEQGDFTVRATDLYSDEFSRLISGFNQMVEGLAHRDAINERLLDSYYATLAAALDARDPYTAGHSYRVAHYAVELGKQLGMSSFDLARLRKSALLHDIGKIGVRDDVLLKTGRLTDEEFEQMKRHPVLGEAILKQVQPSFAMAPLLPGVRSHHERFDGKGYPDELAGYQIHWLGRIIAVADAFDAMTSDRPYRSGMPIEKALEILEDGSGTQWDPDFVAAFVTWVKTDWTMPELPAHIIWATTAQHEAAISQ
ncbi:HD domain-containing phosphohydrolase [Sulfoacidibacillus thermotolerans]|uniref:HD-GYP domain-containing protein n=1 Tax=Sulfoacidibacillus thermotolerans TaxID=1765684 RepID=A0A2U3DB85_SULT2|nr:HD domain-containing phosphohydrolase [Sulfoacidibacillus thermotolerans]PWI58549.1 hypothetical protein BM613_03270 [Sulfoacidibacillus thermotolerans]